MSFPLSRFLIVYDLVFLACEDFLTLHELPFAGVEDDDVVFSAPTTYSYPLLGGWAHQLVVEHHCGCGTWVSTPSLGRPVGVDPFRFACFLSVDRVSLVHQLMLSYSVPVDITSSWYRFDDDYHSCPCFCTCDMSSFLVLTTTCNFSHMS